MRMTASTLTGSTFSSNTATAAQEGEGGATYADDPTTLSTDTFTSNSAIATGSTSTATYAFGGAIYSDDGLALSHNTFTSNKGIDRHLERRRCGGRRDL